LTSSGGDRDGGDRDGGDDWSRRVCWMSLIMRRTGAFSVSHILSFTRAVYKVFILLCEYLMRLFLFHMSKGNEKVDIRKMMT
jgi:hypothetical protein